MPSRSPALKSLILVGCVKSKHSHPSAAQDLYDSRLWRCRRAYAERRAWSRQILDDLAVRISTLRGQSIELHAGKPYIEYGLEDGLREAGAIILRPLAHVVGIGPQCKWYVEQLASGSAQERYRPGS